MATNKTKLTYHHGWYWRTTVRPDGPDTGWVDVPVLSVGGAPAHFCGVTAFPGLYLVGYPWLSNRGSGILYGVAADAARIAQHIAAAHGMLGKEHRDQSPHPTEPVRYRPRARRSRERLASY
jgi:putative flavoprotein involved in K+ transport